jgi:hypothetical protein
VSVEGERLFPAAVNWENFNLFSAHLFDISDFEVSKVCVWRAAIEQSKLLLQILARQIPFPTSTLSIRCVFCPILWTIHLPRSGYSCIAGCTSGRDRHPTAHATELAPSLGSKQMLLRYRDCPWLHPDLHVSLSLAA